jgi:hypothetical protein
MDQENYPRLVAENQELRRTIEGLERLAESFKRDMLRERLWRIGFQLDYLKGLSERTKEELEQLEKGDGNQA